MLSKPPPAKKRIVLFPLDTKAPMPHRCFARTADHYIVKWWKMTELERDVWLTALAAITPEGERKPS